MKYSQQIRNFVLQVLSRQTHADTIALFRLVISLWVIGNALLLLPGGEHFWGENAFVEGSDFAKLSVFEKIFDILNAPEMARFYLLVIILQLVSAVTAGFGFWPGMSSALLYWSTLTLDNRAPVILDGGNNLMHILLFLCIFMVPKSRFAARNALSNACFFVARFQVVFVYATAGLSKVTGQLWPQGMAMYYTMNVAEYGHPLLGELMTNFPLLSVLGSYGTLFFQLSLPFLIWFRKTRWLVLLVGTLFHLGIVFGMGLVSFGFAMCVSYFLFYRNEKSRRILERFSLKKWLVS